MVDDVYYSFCYLVEESMKKRMVVLLLVYVGLLGSCTKKDFREDIIVAGGKYVSAATLNKGKEIYTEYCMACHGVKGDGRGVASKGMKVPPRDFRLGLIKFGDTLVGELPHDEAIFKTLKEGLEGTAMLPWDLSHGQMDAVWQYIKTFSPQTWVGKDKKLGERVSLTKDPYGLARKNSAIVKGREVYHITASCQTCHRAYVTPEELNQMSLKIDGEVAEWDEEFYRLKPQESEYEAMTLPPDFTWDSIRSAKSIEELAFRIAAGVGGTTMPGWKETVEDEEIWAVAYYVKHLMEMKNKPLRKVLMKKLKVQK